MKLLSTVTACALVSAGIEAKALLFPVPQEAEWSGPLLLLPTTSDSKAPKTKMFKALLIVTEN
jgi:hypothetical protein